MKNTGLTAKEVASKFGVTSKYLRRVLRSIERFDDGKYTRYRLNSRDIEQLAKRIKAGEDEKPKPKVKRTRKSTKPTAQPETPATAPGTTEAEKAA